MSDEIRVLIVDDEPEFMRLSADYLSRINEQFDVVTETTAKKAQHRIGEETFHCIISDFEMQDMNGIELLNTVRSIDEELPFFLFTGKGSEEVADRAYAAGATDYLQKNHDPEQFTILANRVKIAVERYRAERDLAERTRRLETLISNLPGIVYRCVNRPTWPMESVEGDCLELSGYPASSFEDGDLNWGADLIHPDDQQSVWREVQRSIEAIESFELTYRIITKDGETKWVWERGRAISVGRGEDKIVLEGFITDITERIDQQERLRVLFEDADDAIVEVIFDDETAVIHEVNPAFETVFGVTAEDVVGARLNDIIVPDDDLPLASELDRRVQEGEIVEEELRRETVTGETWFLLRTVPFTLHGEARAFATYVDISAQKEREESLQALHDATSSMLDASGTQEICSVAVEAASNILRLPSSGIFRYDQTAHDFDPIATTGDMPETIVNELASPQEHSVVWRSYVEGKHRVIEFDHDGTGITSEQHVDQTQSIIVPLGDHGVLIGTTDGQETIGDVEIRLGALLASATATALDTSRREQQLTKLHTAATEISSMDTAQEIFELLVDAGEDILDFDLAVADAAEGEHLVTRATSKAIDQTEYYETTPIDASQSIGAKAYRRQEASITPDLLKTDAAPADPTFRSVLTVPIGSHGVFQAAARQTAGFDGKDLELAELLMAHATEALTRLERTRELKQRSDTLNRQNQRLEKFASIVSHDLRNPLNVATGQLALASEECDSRHLREVTVALDRMDSLIGDTLMLARQGRTVAERDEIELGALATECWDLVESTNSSLIIDQDATFTGDAERVKQVFENLFRNAIEHGGEEVTVRIGSLDEDGIFVEDDGHGISEAKSEAICSAPHTSDNDSGFGLAIVKEIVDAHGWDLTVLNGQLGGARFEIKGISTLNR